MLTARAASRASTPKQVADAAELVFASLPSLAIVRDTALGAAGVVHGAAIKTFVDLSTSGPQLSGQISEGLGAKGIVALDAPVSGGVRGAAEGTLAVMVGGPKASFDALEPILKIFGRCVLHGRDAGRGPDHEAGQQPDGRLRHRHHRRGQWPSASRPASTPS